jgi:hypothetical protein
LPPVTGDLACKNNCNINIIFVVVVDAVTPTFHSSSLNILLFAHFLKTYQGIKPAQRSK